MSCFTPPSGALLELGAQTGPLEEVEILVNHGQALAGSRDIPGSPFFHKPDPGIFKS